MNECNNNKGIKTSKRHNFSNKLTTKCEPVPTFCTTSSFCRCRLAVRRADLRQPEHRLHHICHTWSCSQVSAMRASWCNSCQRKKEPENVAAEVSLFSITRELNHLLEDVVLLSLRLLVDFWFISLLLVFLSGPAVSPSTWPWVWQLFPLSWRGRRGFWTGAGSQVRGRSWLCCASILSTTKSCFFYFQLHYCADCFLVKVTKLTTLESFKLKKKHLMGVFFLHCSEGYWWISSSKIFKIKEKVLNFLKTFSFLFVLLTVAHYFLLLVCIGTHILSCLWK